MGILQPLRCYNHPNGKLLNHCYTSKFWVLILNALILNANSEFWFGLHSEHKCANCSTLYDNSQSKIHSESRFSNKIVYTPHSIRKAVCHPLSFRVVRRHGPRYRRTSCLPCDPRFHRLFLLVLLLYLHVGAVFRYILVIQIAIDTRIVIVVQCDSKFATTPSHSTSDGQINVERNGHGDRRDNDIFLGGAMSRDFQKRFKFVVYRFRHGVWWWGIFFLLRNVMIVSLTLIEAERPFTQLFGMLVVFWFILWIYLKVAFTWK